MTRRWLAMVVVLAMAGCGGDDAVVVLVVPDGGVDACPAVSQCNPLAPRGQQGCPAGDKCTALILATSPQICPDALALGCVPDGVQALGQACTWSAPAGAQPGHDDCVAGAVCASDRVCRDICGFGAGAEEACAGGLTCFAIAGRFEPQGGGDPRFGVCAMPL